MVRMLLTGLLVAVGLVALTPSTSYACYCMTGTPAESAAQADVVFTGVLTHLEPPPQREVMSSLDPNTFTFSVHDVRKGDAGPVTDVKSARWSDSCGIEGMEVGGEYVVYAYAHRGELWTGLCSGTRTTAAPPAVDLAAVTRLPATLWSLLRWP